MRTTAKIVSKENERSVSHKFTETKLFPIVVIGASAGGLEAYSAILKNIPSDTGMAFVIIQHLDPVHKSFLNEIVGRETDMKVNEISSGMQPKPDNVYIIRPNTTVTFTKGKFRSNPRDSKIHKPVDLFMTSLAKDNTHTVIGVIVSGADSDGVIGMEDIKRCGGITLAQNKRTAKFPDMPQNAVAAGVVDLVGSPLIIAKELIKINKKLDLISGRKKISHAAPQDNSVEMGKIFKMLHANNGIDFQNYKPNTIRRRLARRIESRKIKDVKEYVKYLKLHSEELDALCSDLLINVTSFFRDPLMYASLKKNAFPVIFSNKNSTSPVRVWITGCSSGQEAYSMAIAINEYQLEKKLEIPVQIFSTDLSDESINTARTGIYSPDIMANISPKRIKNYFEKYNGKYRVKKNIRSMCVFAKQNIIQDPPFSKIDLISCRNVLIYLGQTLQDNIIPLFHYSLEDNGYLVLGSSESVGKYTHLFKQEDKKNKIYRKKSLSSKIHVDFPKTTSSLHNNSVMEKKSSKKKITPVIKTDQYKVSDSIILNKYSPASVLIDSKLEVVHFRGKSNDYFKIQSGTATFNVLKILRDDLVDIVQELLKKAVAKNIPVSRNEVAIAGKDGKKIINIIILPIEGSSKPEKLYLIVFEDSPNIFYPVLQEKKGKKSGKAADESEKILYLRRELLISNENLQANIEELQSANEEIQSSNEELQSTNEELETAKEELQSTNEELFTVNDELVSSNIELVSSNNDLNNLLSSINIPVILLDNRLCIKRFTNMAGKLLNLIAGDIGRKLTDINIDLTISNLKKLVSEVIKTPTTKEILVKNKKNHWYYMRVRPYLTVENKITGVIIAFLDVTKLKQSLSDIERSNENLLTSKAALEIEVKERKKVEESLRTLSKHLVSAQEVEKKRLARELHDSVNQILSVVKMKLHSTESLVKKEESKAVERDLSDARKLLEKAIEEVRNISKNLRPHAIDDLGLKASLHSIIEEFTKRVKIKVKFKTSQLKNNISKETELNVYRIIQEALHNIEKHSGARNVKIGLDMKNSELHVVVVDDGHGFTMNDQKLMDPNLKSYGLIGMRERAESIGGKFEVKSNPGKGTAIFAALPVNLITT